MSTLIQVLIGFVPAVAILAIIVLIKRGRSIHWDVALALTLVLGAALMGAAAAGMLDIDGSGRTSDAGTDLGDTATSEDFIQVAYVLMDEGEYDRAASVLDGYLDKLALSGDVVLAQARASVLRGDLRAADGLYRVLENTPGKLEFGSTDRHEDELVREAVNAGMTMESWRKAVNAVLENIAGISKDAEDGAKDGVEALIRVENMDSYWDGLDEEQRRDRIEEISDWAQELQRSRDGRRLMTIPAIRDAAVKAGALGGEYGEIVDAVGNECGAQGLLTAAELIDKGLITGKDIRNSPDYSEYEDNSATVEEWIDGQLTDNEYTDQEKEVIDDILSRMDEGSDSSSFAGRWIEERIVEHLAQGREPEASKLYLELARLSYGRGDDGRAAAYLRLALGYAGDSEDPVYAGAAERLLDIINDPEDTEARKNVAQYTAVMNGNLLPRAVKEAVAGAVTQDAGEDADDDAGTEPEYAGNGDDGFEQYVTDTINQSAGALNIISVDASGFDTVKAVVAADESIVSSAQEFRDNLEVLDCSITVDDYEVEKLDYSQVNIVLVCDKSGSMSGDKIVNLKNALNSFIDASDGINIGIVPFDDGVRTGSVVELGGSESRLRDCVSSLDATGGTDIGRAVEYGLGLFPTGGNALNVLILMSDGQDSQPSQDTRQRFAGVCRDKGVSIFSMGLGEDVDSMVMNIYADIGGGSYMYVSDSGSLYSFYQYIYRLCMNRYSLSFTAPDTMKVSRELEIRGISEASVYDDYRYYLYETDVSEGDLGEDYDVTSGGVTLSGLENRLFYSAGVEQYTYLLGSNFKKEDTVKVELKGGVKYELAAEYKDDGHIRVTVPSNVACGVYDVYVTYNKERTVFSSGFVMTSNDAHIVRFGDYVFTATDISADGDALTLKGVVNMNGWLGFTGDVTLRGNLKEDYAVKFKYDGAYLQYTDNGTSKGLAKHLAKRGYTLRVPSAPEMELYNDASIPSSDDEYPVDEAFLDAGYVNIVDFAGLSGAGMSLYPDRMVIDFEAFNTKFPFQDVLAKAAGTDELFSFKLKHNEKVLFTSEQIGCDISVELGQNSGDKYGKLGNLDLMYKDAGIKLDLNTIDGEATVKFTTDIKALADGIGLELGWKDWKFDTVKLYADAELDMKIGSIPATIHDFSLGVTDMSAVEDPTANTVLQSKLEGSFDLSLAKISKVCPGVNKYLIKTGLIDDAAVAKLDDTTISLRLKDFYFSVKTTAKLFEVVELGKCSIELGTGIPYTNTLLGFEDETVTGFVGSLSVGPKVETSNLLFDTHGSVEFALTNKIFGVTVDGEVTVEVSWWIFSKEYFTKGEAFLGVYQKHNGDWQFAVYAARADGNGGNMDPVYWPDDALDSRNF